MKPKLENSLIFTSDYEVAVIHLGAALVHLYFQNVPIRHHVIQAVFYLRLRFSEYNFEVGELQLSAYFLSICFFTRVRAFNLLAWEHVRRHVVLFVWHVSRLTLT